MINSQLSEQFFVNEVLLFWWLITHDWLLNCQCLFQELSFQNSGVWISKLMLLSWFLELNSRNCHFLFTMLSSSWLSVQCSVFSSQKVFLVPSDPDTEHWTRRASASQAFPWDRMQNLGEHMLHYIHVSNTFILITDYWLLITDYCSTSCAGGGERDRTDDLLRARQALSQLSYTPRIIAALWSDVRAQISEQLFERSALLTSDFWYLRR